MIEYRARCRLKKSALELPYVDYRIRKGYLHLRENQLGTILGETVKGDKYAIEFEEPIWSLITTVDESGAFVQRPSANDTGCHNRGKLRHCHYIPKTMVDIEVDGDSHPQLQEFLNVRDLHRDILLIV